MFLYLLCYKMCKYLFLCGEYHSLTSRALSHEGDVQKERFSTRYQIVELNSGTIDIWAYCLN